MNIAVRRTVVAAASAVLLLSGFAAVAQARGGNGNNNGTPPVGGEFRHPGFGSGAGLGRGFGGPGGAVIHGEGVVKDKDGKFVTQSVQRGKASKISATSVTVTSDDKFARTYVLTKDTKGTPKDGATVTVIATKTGSTWTAKVVLIPGQRPTGAPGDGFRRGHHDGQSPTPGPSASSSPAATT